jgi:hypothetical protein
MAELLEGVFGVQRVAKAATHKAAMSADQHEEKLQHGIQQLQQCDATKEECTSTKTKESGATMDTDGATMYTRTLNALAALQTAVATNPVLVEHLAVLEEAIQASRTGSGRDGACKSGEDIGSDDNGSTHARHLELPGKTESIELTGTVLAFGS